MILRRSPPHSDERADDRRAEVDELIDAGRLVEAVDLLTELDRAHPDPDDDVRLVVLRHRAAAELADAPCRDPWPPQYQDPYPDVVGQIPEVDAAQLTTELLGGAVAHHGALIVRNVFAADQVERLVDAIETTHASQDDGDGGDGTMVAREETSWYRPFPTTQHNGVLRRMVASQGGTWLADSPSSTKLVLGELTSAGIVAAIARHLGERPVFSLQKSTLRRSLPKPKLVAWHQDGSFLDPDVRTMNVWVALSPCGGDLPAPGLEIMPRPLAEVLPVDGLLTKHAVAEELVAELATDTPTVIPEFAPGDAILFDQLLLHRTHLTASMTEVRYALECWFFAPSHPARGYTPLLA